MKKLLVFILFLTSISAVAQKTDNHLQNEINNLLKGFNGDVGVYVYDISKNKNNINFWYFLQPFCAFFY